MSLLRCCCAGSSSGASCGTCPALPADWATREYRLDIPQAFPLQYSDPQVPSSSPLDLGWCDPADDGVVGKCQYVNRLYGYWQWWSPCTTESVYVCWKRSKEMVPQYGGGYWNTLRPDISATPPHNAAKVVDFGNATNGGRITLSLQRCATGTPAPPTPCANRTRLDVYVELWQQYSYQNCPTQAVQTVTVLCTYEATYLGDPYTAAEAISPTLYLKNFHHITPRHYCSTPDSGYWQVADFWSLSTAAGGVLTTSPCPLPSWITITRTA